MSRLIFLRPDQVAALPRSQREDRVKLLVEQSHAILNRAIERHVLADGRAVAGTVVLFSGGNDSTVLAHLFRPHASHAAHANTTIGLEATREFVRRTCREWSLPLMEFKPPNPADHYETTFERVLAEMTRFHEAAQAGRPPKPPRLASVPPVTG
ncbi:hypothetical protein [Nocardioides sp. YIM 152588]|uniref:hypothetical protein n=1 Tax=Nocardioides sp. YIM 152588 TaxID=3158259 RepID=UPI0032E3CA66